MNGPALTPRLLFYDWLVPGANSNKLHAHWLNTDSSGRMFSRQRRIVGWYPTDKNETGAPVWDKKVLRTSHCCD